MSEFEHRRLGLEKGQEKAVGEFGILVKRRRLLLGWTQTRTATEAGMTQVYYNLIERGRRRPSAAIMLRLAAALGIDPKLAMQLVYPDHARALAPERVADLAGIEGLLVQALAAVRAAMTA